MMIRTLLNIARDWYSADRIRVTRRHGQLLQLSVPSFVIIAGKTLAIHAAHRDHERLQTIYDCEHEGQPSRLQVQFTQLGRVPAIVWVYGDQRIQCSGDDIEWFTPIRSPRDYANGN